MNENNFDSSVQNVQTVEDILKVQGRGEPARSIRKCVDPVLLDEIVKKSKDKEILTAVMENPFANPDTIFKLSFVLKEYHSKLTRDVLRYRDLSDVSESVQLSMARVVMNNFIDKLKNGKDLVEELKSLGKDYLQPCFENLKGPMSFFNAFLDKAFIQTLKEDFTWRRSEYDGVIEKFFEKWKK